MRTGAATRCGATERCPCYPHWAAPRSRRDRARGHRLPPPGSGESTTDAIDSTSALSIDGVDSTFDDAADVGVFFQTSRVMRCRRQPIVQLTMSKPALGRISSGGRSARRDYGYGRTLQGE